MPAVSIESPCILDHSLLSFELPLPRPPVQEIDIETRAWKGFDADRFRDDLLKSRLCMPSGGHDALSVDELQNMYDITLKELLDKHAPSRSTKRISQPLTPWFDSECAAARRKTRALERRYQLAGIRSPGMDGSGTINASILLNKAEYLLDREGGGESWKPKEIMEDFEWSAVP